MTMPPEVARCADALSEAIKQTDAYREYDSLRKSVLSDEVNRRLLERFGRAQTALQMCALSGSEPREEDTAEFERLSALLYDTPELSDYLLSQMRVQQLVAACMERITEDAGVHFDI